jgi:hypothetical protein
MTTIPLRGIERDSALGWLALLGLLRALDAARLAWFARAYWHGIPPVAQLVVAADVDPDDVAKAAVEGCAAYRRVFAFGDRKDVSLTAQETHQTLDAARGTIGDEIWSALCSDVVITNGKGVATNPLVTMAGQGHQHFLERLTAIAATEGLPEQITAALFAPWKRADNAPSLRWDYADDRRYALRADDPSGDKQTTEHGAHRLAILGLLSYQSAPQVDERWGRVSLATRGWAREHRTTIATWPLWEHPARLGAIEAMLDSPSFTRGVTATVRAERVAVGKFRTVGRGSETPLTGSMIAR